MSISSYEARYIKTALNSPDLPVPERSQCKQWFSVLECLYEGHKADGNEGAKRAWETVKRLQPDVVQFEQSESNIIRANDLKFLTAPEYVSSTYPIYHQGLNAVVGASGAGKSFVTLDAVASLASDKLPVVYIAAEGLHGYSGRWEAWKQFHKRDSDHLFFYKQEVIMTRPENMQPFIQEIAPYRPQLVVVDTVARCMTGADENSTREMGLFVASCYQLINQMGCGVLVVHHTGKDGTMRGSNALRGACDSVMFLSRSDDTIKLSNSYDDGGKNKHGAELPTRYLKLLPQSVTVDNELYESAVIIETDRVVQSPDDKLSKNQQLILESVDGYDKGLTAQTIINSTSIKQSTVYYNLKALVKSGHLSYNDVERYLITEKGQDVLSNL